MKNDVMSLKSSTSWGKDSILSWMVNVDALICPLGLDWHSACSLFHIIEEDLQVPYRYFKRFSGDMLNIKADISEKYGKYASDTTMSVRMEEDISNAIALKIESNVSIENVNIKRFSSCKKSYLFQINT